MSAIVRPTVLVPAAVAAVLLAAALAVAIGGGTGGAVGALVAAGLLTGAVAAGAAAHALAPGEPDVERRQDKGPGLRRRQLMMGAGAGAAALAAGAFSVPAARRAATAADQLRSSGWQAGSRVVDSEGRPVVVAEVREGELLTVYPEGAVGSVQAQAVLIRENPARYLSDAERDGWVPEGVAVYSKLCTHMACPVGLYQQQTGTILCPCHQAVFDLLDSGRAVAGPARRALPQLPVDIDDSGGLVARGDFSDAVGTGFWGRP